LSERKRDVLNYRSVSLNAELVDRVERLIRRLGTYRTIAEFVKEAVRLRLEALEKQNRRAGGVRIEEA
jgi:Arc/MetJ-type ribon-helix-helix transcriptional regulator